MSVPENTTEPVLVVEAQPGGDRDTVATYAISGGRDADRFTLDAATGELAFVEAPDYEQPTDADGDNVYRLVVAARFPRAGIALQRLAVTVTDVSQLEVEVSYPTDHANLGGGVTSTTVAGRLHDLEDGVVSPGDAVRLDVNGVPAAVREDDPARWSTRVDVTAGANTIDVEVRSRGSDIADHATLSVDNHVTLDTPEQIEIDAAGSAAYVHDRGLQAIVRVELDSGDAEIVAGLLESAESRLVSGFGASGWALDETRNRLLLISVLEQIVAVDLSTGAAHVVADAVPDTQPPNRAERVDIAVHSDGQRAFATDADLGLVYEFDLDTMQRTTLSAGEAEGEPAIGSGPLVLDETHDRALTCKRPAHSEDLAVIAVDLATGARETVWIEGTFEGEEPTRCDRLSVDDTGRRLFVGSYRLVYEIDLGAETSRILTGETQEGERFGSGPGLVGGVWPMWDHARDRLLVTNEMSGDLIAVDPMDGTRTVIHSARVGAGLPLSWPSVALDVAGGQLYARILEPTQTTLAISLADASRQVVVAPDLGAGSDEAYGWLAWDAPRHRLIATRGSVDTRPFLALDPVTGDRSVIAAEAPHLQLPVDWSALALDPDAERAYAVDRGAGRLVSLDLIAERVDLVADASTGLGPPLQYPVSLAVDAQRGRLLVGDPLVGGIVAVDPVTGDRSVMAGDGVGSGPGVDSVTAIAVDARRDQALVASFFGLWPSLLRVDLETGDREADVDPRTGDDTFLDTPSSIVVDAENDRAFISESGIQVLDLESGERAIFAR